MSASGAVRQVSADAPLGVFDSGLGGLTVAAAIRRTLPRERIVYLGDTARVPYGRKPKAMVQEFAREVVAFLAAQGVEAVMIACNTASACALPGLAAEAPVPVWGVIEPGVEAAARQMRSQLRVVRLALPPSGRDRRHQTGKAQRPDHPVERRPALWSEQDDLHEA